MGVRKPHIAEAQQRDAVVIRFAGDSGDGMQLTGNQFTTTSALAGNDVATLPDFPAEIRAPMGTVPGVSGFQLQFSSKEIFTPGDAPDVLVAMNAAALKVNLPSLDKGRTVIVNTDGFNDANLSKAGYQNSPLEDGTLDGYQSIPVPLTTLTLKVLKDSPLPNRGRQRCKNFFALGLMYWLYSRSLETTEQWIRRQFARSPDVVEANLTALGAGYAYADASELFQVRYEVPAAPQQPGPVPQHHRQQGSGARVSRGVGESGRAAVCSVLSHHTGLRHSRGTGSLQAARCGDHAGGRRDRRRLLGHRSLVWGSYRSDDDERTWADLEGGSDRVGRDHRAPGGDC